jgi:hypothetical protein
MDWKQLLAYITGSVNEELLLRNEYLVMENRILRNQITGRVRLTDAERKTLVGIGKRLGKQVLKEVATIVKPDPILAWHRKLVAQKFDSSQQRKTHRRPRIDEELEAAGVMRVVLPPRSPNLNAHAERWVRSVKEEALSQLILFGERSLRHVLNEYVDHYHHERNHQGKGNVLLFPSSRS